MTAPIAYLVTERRQGDVLLGDDWTHRCDDLEQAREVAGRWRAHGGPVDIVTLAVIEVTDGFDHRLTPEGREGFLAAIAYIRLAARMSSGEERATLVGIANALQRKADQEYLIGKPSAEAQS